VLTRCNKNPIGGLGGVALTRYMDGWTDGQGDSYIPPKTLFAGGIITSVDNIVYWCYWRIVIQTLSTGVIVDSCMDIAY
jgi:hypothetical protein